MRTKTKEISNSDDIIDSRDVIERIAELQDQESTSPDDDVLDDDERAELAALLEFAEEAEHYVADWRYGAILIRDSYFEEYAREFAEEIDAVGRGERWPFTCIDWGKAADELKQDYSADGVTYQVR